MMDAFFLLDQDKDGNLTPSELPGVTAEAIRAADTDSDGKLSAIEYMNSITARNATTEPTRISASSILHSTFNMLTSPLGEPLRS
jgi:Ca2+-binding EF-hand superfamily protein